MTDREKAVLLDQYFQKYRLTAGKQCFYITDVSIMPSLIVFTQKSCFIKDRERRVALSIREFDGVPIIKEESKERKIEESKTQKPAGLKSLFAAETGLELMLKIWWFMWMLTFFYPIYKTLFSLLAK